jgi:thioredoxin reductase (NADPH)
VTSGNYVYKLHVKRCHILVEKVIILGAGPAGLSAAIYTSREGFEPLVIGGYNPGGQLLLTTVVENIPGFPDGIDGPEIVSRMRQQAQKFGTRFIDQNASEVDFSKKPYKVVADGKTYEAETLIIATGANAKWLGIPSEQKFVGRGVSSCGTCDGPFFKNKDVIVVGGGDTAMEDALFLTRFATSVTIMHRREEFKASKIMLDRARSNPKMRFIVNKTIEEILGGVHVTGVRLKDVKTNEITEMKIDGVFIAIGYAPNTEIFKGKLNLNAMGYIVPKSDEVLTEYEGVFVAGDVADHFYRQAATAMGSGVKAALHVREYLSMLQYERGKKGV